ncbi:flagellar hook-associated protein FlgK [Erwinia persicina]|uniref:Flagellar hook-associated protein 1 n=1 Tax=Erwinia persicina TaxID=55211 RepID=A0A3S7S4F2_9GAMM|nr:flagellar hook-associated protein FlgK [Erwinia persicina]AXU95601.1 flagellar hook-associated protein FlgK [Erwinia persicina]MBD8108757.1 flagellar hook-associated protein FlgK [Erwinia persicina]MBD8166167.1 flagellar hook-associated protein FlgK [Erwinia persicina]MBD8211862.1 flagellar hook-associated protein FlgK [Erwinia persicina]MCQ4092801.1 flagellar hook-associated protein FlgK [Erwinia persicina]
MANLINTAMSGLSAASAALNTTSNNITNYAVTGYSRQTTVLAQANSTLSGNNYYGNGANVSTVYREYDQFITNQLRAASAQSSAITTQYGQVSSLDDIFSSTTNTLSTNMQDFFSSLQTLSSNASDSSARQAVIGKAQGLVNQFQVTDTYLSNLDSSVNTSVKSTVDQINNYAKQIANVNQQITKLKGAGAGSEPNNLLDQRDQLVSELNKLVGVSVNQQNGGSYNISIGNGISLVQGDTYSQLAAVPSSADPARTTLATVDPATGQKTQFSEKLITTGSLGGLLAFRSDLDGARNQVGQLAMALGSSFNAQHMQGKDSDGDAGGAFFSLGTPSVLANTNNTGGASLTATWSDTTRVQASDYSVSYDGTNWTATRLSDNTKSTVTVDATAKTLSFDGLSVAYDQLPASKDSFTIKPVSSVVSGMSVLVTEESKLAAASSTGGASNNENVQKLLGLQTANVINGKSTLTQGYASLVAQVGNKASTLETTSKTQTAVVTQLTNQQQSVSGVNLDEEYSNLTRYQQYYMANAQVLQTASTIFQSLIGAVS